MWSQRRLNPRDQWNGLARLPRRPRVTPEVRRASGGYGHVSQAASPVEEYSTAILLQEQVGYQLGNAKRPGFTPSPLLLSRNVLWIHCLIEYPLLLFLVGSLQTESRISESSVSIQGDSRCRGPWLSSGDNLSKIPVEIKLYDKCFPLTSSRHNGMKPVSSYGKFDGLIGLTLSP